MELINARPTLEVGDLGATVDFLRDVVGLTPDVVQGEPPVFAIFGEGAVSFGLVEVDHPAIPDGAACYLTITGLDDLISRIDAAGIALDLPLTTRPWGQRDIVVTLPGEGPKVAFGETV